MLPDEKTLDEIKVVQEEFTVLLNEAIEQFRNADDSIPSYTLIGIQSTLLMTAGFMEGLLKCNAKVMTGFDRPGTVLLFWAISVCLVMWQIWLASEIWDAFEGVRT